jgi:hypothetical protein
MIFLVTALLLLLVASWAEWGPGRLPRVLIPLFVLVVFGAPAAERLIFEGD